MPSLIAASLLLLLITNAFAAQLLPASLQTCLDNIGAFPILPQSSIYNDTAKSQNTNYDYKPAAILQPFSTQQTSDIVKCVKNESGDRKLSTFGGGHGYASYALGGQDGYIVIDSSNMKEIALNEDSRTVTVGVGQRIGPVSAEIGKKGYGLPHGTCSSVGVTGHALGGGWGFSSRKWGWLMDRISCLTLVDPAGNVRSIKADSQNQDEDLWWALRGAGANNFGVVTSLTFDVAEAPRKAVNYKTVFQTNDECAEALIGFQELGSDPADVNGLSSTFGAQLLLYGEGNGASEGACQFSGQYLGPISEFRTVQKKLNDTFAGRGIKIGQFNATEFDGWIETLTDLMGKLDASPTTEGYYAKSLVDDGSPGYSKGTALNITKAVQATVEIAPGTSVSFDLNGPGSATNSEQNSAFAVSGHRSSLFLTQIYVNNFPGFDNSTGEDKAYEVVDAVAETIQATSPSDAWLAYVNYVDPRLQNFGQMYFGQALGRLKLIKKEVDPNTIFDYPQGLAHA